MDKKQNEKNSEESTEEINESTNNLTEETETIIENLTETTDSEKTAFEPFQTNEEQTEPEPAGFKKFVKHFDKKIAIFSVAFLLVGLMAGSQLSGNNHRSYGAQGISKRYNREDRASGRSEKAFGNGDGHKDFDAERNDRQKDDNFSDSTKGNQKSSDQKTSDNDVTSGATESQKNN